MLAKTGVYYDTPFKGNWGVTQGGPLSPTLFNVLVDAMTWHWIMVLADVGAGTGGFVRAVHMMVMFFYADNGLLAFMRP